MSKQELLRHLMEFFPQVNTVLGDQELKYNIIMKYAQEPKEVQKEKLSTLDDLLAELTESGVLTRFEFNGTVNYKAKKEIPINLGGSSAPSPSTGTSGQLKDLSDLVLALASTSNDENVKQLADAFRSNYP